STRKPGASACRAAPFSTDRDARQQPGEASRKASPTAPTFATLKGYMNEHGSPTACTSSSSVFAMTFAIVVLLAGTDSVASVMRQRPASGSKSSGAMRIAREDGLDRNAPDRREYVGFECGQSAQLVRQRQNVLPHRHIRENPVHDGGRRIGHAPPSATRAHGSRLARERNEEIVTARIAPRAREPLGEDTTFEVSSELGLDIAGEATVVVLAGVREKRFDIPVYKTVENG